MEQASDNTTSNLGIINVKLVIKMSQSDHTSNFHDYVIISVHIYAYIRSIKLAEDEVSNWTVRLLQEVGTYPDLVRTTTEVVGMGLSCAKERRAHQT